MTFYYKIIYKRRNREITKIVKNGELSKLINRCNKKSYSVINIEYV